MATNDSISERRLFMRFPVKGHAMIAIDSWRGELIDISFGGLAFHYTGNRLWSDGILRSAMLCGADDFCLQLPLTLVSDRALGKAKGGTHTAMRRCGMRFGELSANQLIQLIAFIRDNTLEQELPEAGTEMWPRA